MYGYDEKVKLSKKVEKLFAELFASHSPPSLSELSISSAPITSHEEGTSGDAPVITPVIVIRDTSQRDPRIFPKLELVEVIHQQSDPRPSSSSSLELLNEFYHHRASLKMLCYAKKSKKKKSKKKRIKPMY